MIDGRRGLEWLGPARGTDTLRYSGESTAFVLKGPAAVYRNGERVDPAAIG